MYQLPMKRTIVIGVMVSWFCVVATARDANNDRSAVHYASFSAAGGWYSLLETLPDLYTTGAGAATLGVGYELRYKNFWFGIGVDVQYFSSISKAEQHTFSQAMYDTQGKQMTMHYHIYSDKETAQGVHVGLPIMVGAQFLNGFYFGGGVHVQLNTFLNASSQIEYETSATYSRYIEDFEDMPNHWYQPYPASGSASVDVPQPQVSLMAEIGYDVFGRDYNALSTLHPPVLKIAAFAEIGVRNALHNEGDLHRYTVNDENPIYLDIVPYHRAIDTNVNRFMPLFVGLKLTYLFRLPKHDCRCL